MVRSLLNTKTEKTTLDFINERVRQGQNVGLINLGCARNLVDSQAILGRLKKSGHRIVDMKNADIAIVNTCSFIEEAKQESIDTILDLLELKKQGKIKQVIVAGCLAQRYGKELAEEFKDIDAIVGTLPLDRESVPEHVSLTPAHYAYVKICESCFNSCSFCAIPGMKGKFVSRTIESVLAEIKQLDERGVREINIIGQDITAYGMDIYRQKSLARLLKELIPVTKNIQWIRLLYAFPAHVTEELIDVMAQEEKICKYIDMPLQHISDHILKNQNRNITTQGTIDLIKRLKDKIPAGSLRTTFIVGLPGETQADFDQMLDFVKATRFEKAGVFVYSREEGTAAYAMPNHVAEPTKRKRMDILMRAQQEISKEIQQQCLGKTFKVLIEEKEKGEDNIYLGRTEYDAPEVDGLVYVHSLKPLAPGDFVQVKVTDTYEYDLAGEVV
jgi:ribosomal protein S12 methylthiotransferase